MGIFVLNYIDDIIGFAPDSIAESHFQLTVGTLLQLGFNLSNSKTVAPTSGAICLGISFNIEIGTIQIPHTKLQEVLSLCKFYFSKSKLLKNNCRLFLVLLCSYTRPLNLLGYLLIASWLYYGRWAM
jgi:hypothetical protein